MNATLSPCRRYRYTLERELVGGLAAGGGSCLFVCLNPSTADELVDDPTVRRCAGFARGWGYDRLVICNLFAFRASDPGALRFEPDPVGPDNDAYLHEAALRAGLVVCAWGIHGALRNRDRAVCELLVGADVELHALGLTKHGAPQHPLYLRGDLAPALWPGLA